MADLLTLALELGFDHAAPLDTGKLRALSEVREMCAAGRCQKYDTNWACPPACGTLEEMAEKAKHFSKGILIQTIGDVEDSFDFEAMAEISKQNETNFNRLVDALIDAGVDCWPMTDGTCTRCKACTYPDAPCRFPDRRVSSMEACGLVVMDTCKANGLGYYYGPQSIAYTSCFLLE